MNAAYTGKFVRKISQGFFCMQYLFPSKGDIISLLRLSEREAVQDTKNMTRGTYGTRRRSLAQIWGSVEKWFPDLFGGLAMAFLSPSLR